MMPSFIMPSFTRHFSFWFGIFSLLAVSLVPAQTVFYWEAPEVFSTGRGSFPVSVSSRQFSAVAWQENSPNRNPALAADGTISVQLAVKEAGGSWQRRGAVGDPYAYSGTEPSILSMVIDNQGRIIIAVAASTSETEILVSDDQGMTFSRNRVDMGSETSVAPRLYVRADGGYLLFVTRGRDQSLSLYCSRSSDAATWSPFEMFVNDPGLQLNFLPAHGSIDSRDFVVFQSFVGSGDSIPAFQLYIKTSDNGGETWTQARLFTGFSNAGAPASARYDNQRPFLAKYGDSLFLVWERRTGNQAPQIYGAIINRDGNITGGVERINSNDAYCNNPIAFVYENTPTVVWFDNSQGINRIFLARRTETAWQNYNLPPVSGEASFGRPVIDRDGLFVFWQTVSGNTSRIYTIAPDRSVETPRLQTVNFAAARRSGGERARITWNTPRDTSGIYGFSYAWSQDKNARPSRQVSVYNTNANAPQTMDLIATEDGSWYFSVIAQDYAGNWSDSATVEFIRDTTPPPAASIIAPETDARGFLVSNDITMEWNPPPASDIAGYTWNLQYLGERLAGGADEASITAPPNHVLGTGTSASFDNQDDGVWSFTVSAIDEVGNIGPASNIIFTTNKYIPHTYITYVDSNQDEQGLLAVRILGRGFANGGDVYRLTLERENPPLAREFLLSRGDYTVRSDREISGLLIEDLEEGVYRIRLDHPIRGVYRTGPLITAARTGTVKFGDFSREWKSLWGKRVERPVVFDSRALVIVLIVFCA